MIYLELKKAFLSLRNSLHKTDMIGCPNNFLTYCILSTGTFSQTKVFYIDCYRQLLCRQIHYPALSTPIELKEISDDHFQSKEE